MVDTPEIILDESKQLALEYRRLLRISYQTLSVSDKKLIRLAFNTAVEAHNNQRRKSGEAYIFHPVAVAKIVASEIGMDAISIASALLHDVVEDTSLTLEDIKKTFGGTICKIVDGLTKITALKQKETHSSQAENFKKVLLTLNDDLRIILIKIADRLHNMKTMGCMRADKQEKIASETLFIYAPIAHRLGLYNIKNELEDLSLRYTEPKVYNQILTKTEETKQEQKKYIRAFIKIIDNCLAPHRIELQIKGRSKTIYSIYQKIKAKNISFEEVYDKFAIRIIYKSVLPQEKWIAWKIYTIITNTFQPNPLRLRDWITSPKSTGYEALHITVMGPKGRWVEVQIRSERMDEIAEKGYAAHFKYKHGNTLNSFDDWLNRIRDVLENNKENAVEFIQELKLDLYENEIFTFTPKGEIKSLPRSASPLDFAFAIHSEVGLHAKSAKVNQVLVPLNHKLKTADQVEIITSDEIMARSRWLSYAKTAKAKFHVRRYIRERRKNAIQKGEEVLKRKLHLLKINMNPKVLESMMDYFKVRNLDEIFYNIYIKSINNDMLRAYSQRFKGSFFANIRNRIIRGKPSNLPIIQTKNYNYDLLVFGEEEEKQPFTLSECCHPIPGDDVFGFTNADDDIEVHKKDCKNAISIQSSYAYRVLQARWIDSSKKKFTSIIDISGIDDIGLVHKVTETISKNSGVRLNSITFTAEGNFFIGTVDLEVQNNETLQKLIYRLKKIDGVDKVTRKRSM